MLNMKLVEVEKPVDMNFILGQAHFAPQSAEDIYEGLIKSCPGIKFGLAFCEASDERLVRLEGNDKKLMDIAGKNALKIGAGHSFIIFMENSFPLNVLGAVRSVATVCNIFCATGNPTRVVVAEYEQGRGILGVLDGGSVTRLETDDERQKRRDFLRMIGYKLGPVT